MKSLFSSFLQPYVGNSKNGWQYCGLKGQVKYLKTYYMDHRYNGESDRLIIVEEFFNTRGDLVTLIERREDKMPRYFVYEYERGLLKPEKGHYIYDNNGYLIEVQDKNYSDKYIYNANGELMEILNQWGNSQQITKFAFNTKGLITHKYLYDLGRSESIAQEKEIFEYDPLYHLISYQMNTSIIEYQYLRYDNKGNWLYRLEDYRNKFNKIYITQRQIEYYL